MSIPSDNSPRTVPPAATLAAEPVYYGLPLTAWVKIVTIAALMALLFRFNLARLWSKTNLFTGQKNWEHATFLPLIGLYYLYVWRDELLARPAGRTPADAGAKWTLPGVWGVYFLVGLAAAAVACLTVPAPAGGGAVVGGLSLPANPAVVTWSLAALGVWGLCLAAWVYARRDDLSRPRAQQAAAAVWRLLAAWLLLALAAEGVGFFVRVAHAGAFLVARWGIGVLSLAGLVAVVAGRESAGVRRAGEWVLAASAGWFGAFVLGFGILFSFWGIYPGQNDFFKDMGMVVALFGVVTLLAGWGVMRVAWFPIVFLLCAVPWPDQVYSKVAGPLQGLAARVAVSVLNVTGVDADNAQGTKIVMMGNGGAVRTLNVAEACAGLRSLMTFVSVAAAVAFLSARPLWQKIVLTASAVPIAIFCNVMRVSGQGLLDFYVSEKWSSGFAHGFAGLVMLIPGFFLILLVAWVLDKLFIEVVEDADRLNRPPANRIVRARAVAAAARVGPRPRENS